LAIVAEADTDIVLATPRVTQTMRCLELYEEFTGS
jgi:hypothetical protein